MYKLLHVCVCVCVCVCTCMHVVCTHVYILYVCIVSELSSACIVHVATHIHTCNMYMNICIHMYVCTDTMILINSGMIPSEFCSTYTKKSFGIFSEQVLYICMYVV